MKLHVTAALLLTCACHEGSSGASTAPAPAGTNFGLAVAQMTGEGELWLLCVSEAEEGGVDRNGDGDALDHVAAVLDLDTGGVTNLGRALTPPPNVLWRMSGGRAAFAVPEAAEGADLNGDGDRLDNGTFLYEHATGVTRDLGISNLGFPFLTTEFLGLSVSEYDEGRDLTGDSSLFHVPLFYLDLAADEFVNTEHTVIPEVANGRLLYTLAELEHGDLNGDGDVLDNEVVVLHDMRTRQRHDLGLAASGGAFFADGLAVFGVSERDQSGQDLNGDGDAGDRVVHIFDADTGQLTNTGLGGSGRNGTSRGGANAGGWLLFVTDESNGIDQNQDGDLFDLLPVLYERASGRTLQSGVAVTPFYVGTAFVGERLAIAVKESEEQADLDGDGDWNDLVVHLLDPRDGRVRNLGQTTVFTLAGATNGWLELGLLEQDERDWNGDGDEEDYVPVFADSRSSRVRVTDLQTTGPALVLLDERALFVTREPELAGFGFEYLVHDIRSGRSQRLGLHSGFEPRTARVDGTRALLTANEGAQGEDLNGDGDQLDDVLFLLE